MGWREIRHFLAFLHVSREEGTFIPLSTEVRRPTLGRTYPASHSMTLLHLSRREGVANLIGQSPGHSKD